MNTWPLGQAVYLIVHSRTWASVMTPGDRSSSPFHLRQDLSSAWLTWGVEGSRSALHTTQG